MAVEVEYNGSVIASLEVGQTATLNCAGKKMKTNFSVMVPQNEGDGGSSAVAVTSGTFTPTSDEINAVSVAHGLGVMPDLVLIWTESYGVQSQAPYYFGTCVGLSNAMKEKTGQSPLIIFGAGGTGNINSLESTNKSSVYLIADETNFYGGSAANNALYKQFQWYADKTYNWIAVAGLT